MIYNFGKHLNKGIELLLLLLLVLLLLLLKPLRIIFLRFLTLPILLLFETKLVLISLIF
jgi:hypothetical protein